MEYEACSFCLDPSPLMLFEKKDNVTSSRFELGYPSVYPNLDLRTIKLCIFAPSRAPLTAFEQFSISLST